MGGWGRFYHVVSNHVDHEIHAAGVEGRGEILQVLRRAVVWVEGVSFWRNTQKHPVRKSHRKWMGLYAHILLPVPMI